MASVTILRVLLLTTLLTNMAWADSVTPVLDYIERNWEVLRRAPRDLHKSAIDPKLGQLERWPVYVPEADFQRVKERLKKLDSVELLPLDGSELKTHGLLYLPHPYVVPGGRFNEMYGWDSYFINLGLLESGKVQAARHMVDNHLYQVKHYGKVLNANRSYYLNRSQPPFLASMVGDVYRLEKDKEWLRGSLPQLQATYDFWTSPPHLVPETGLSRYYSLGEGPAPEVLASERDEQGRDHYQRIKLAYQELKADPGYDISLYYDQQKDELTPLFYKGDRTMRESGFDPSDRFGRFNVDVIHYLPVDLNCLLYKYELEMSRLEPEQGELWLERAETRKGLIKKYLWDEEQGLYFDYNFRTKKRRVYPFATTFFPLWTGVAGLTEARRVEQNLSLFERPGGIVTSNHVSGNQWDAPFGWAPLQLVAVDGLRRYGFQMAADRVATKFLSLIVEDFAHSGTIVEKYDVEARSSRVSKGIEFGYDSNEIGFGWTNAVFLSLWNDLPEAVQANLRSDQRPGFEMGAKNGTQAEYHTIALLDSLRQVHNLEPWEFTKKLVVDENGLPHSHPILTLHTRHNKKSQRDMLLSTYLHEQLHWYLDQNPDKTVAAMKALHQIFPKVPSGFPEGGYNEESTYLHLLVCRLELDLISKLLSPERVRQVEQFWMDDHYTWIYKAVIDQESEIRAILSETGLAL